MDMDKALINIADWTDKLFEIYSFGFEKDSIERYKEDMHKHVISRLGNVFDRAKYVVIERSYVEPEWKDMVSLHYINTTYSHTLKNRTIRVHFLKDDDCSAKSHLGFITLRPIEEMQIVLSQIFINWDNFERSENRIYQFVNYTKRIHCLGKELFIHTYPLLTQDSIVTCCADVNVITLSRFIFHKFGGKKLKISDICGEEYNVIFPRTVQRDRLVELCTKNRIPLKLHHYYGQEFASNKKARILDAVNAYLDSDIPVMVISGEHVVQIVGYRRNESVPDEREYLIFDDSGAHDPSRRVSIDNNVRGRFCYYVDLPTWMLQILESGEDRQLHIKTTFTGVVKREVNRKFQEEMHYVSLGVPISERVYIEYDQYKALLDKELLVLFPATSELHNLLFDERNKLKRENVTVRTRLIECNAFMLHILDNLNFIRNIIAIAEADKQNQDFFDHANSIHRNLNQAYIALTSIPLPHYLWYTELQIKSINSGRKIYGIIADPTKFYIDNTHLHKVFFEDYLKSGCITIIKSLWDER